MAFEFENYAVGIYSTNEIPESSDKTNAYWRRWVFIPFLRVFEGENKDKDLKEKLTTESEVSGLLNLALIGVKLIEQDGGFDEQDVDEIRQRWTLGISTLNEFIRERCVLGDDEKVTTADFQDAYRRYCREKDLDSMDETRLGIELKRIGIEKKRLGTGSRRVYYYLGIGILGTGILGMLNPRNPS